MRARQEDLRTARLATNVINVGPDTVAVAEDLARQQFVTTHDRLAAAEIDHDVAILDPLDDAVDDVADAILVFRVLTITLGLTDLLHDHLLGRLRSDATVFERRQGIGNCVADLRGRMALARLFERNLVGWIFDEIGRASWRER